MQTIPERQIREEQKPLSIGEYSKGKINEHYEEVLRLRKEISQRQCHWGKQKTNLLSKIEIMNLQNGQIKQRLAQLSKVNHTLQLALSSKDETQHRSRKDDPQWQALQQQLQEKTRINKQLRKVTEELKRKIVVIQTDKNNLQQSLNQRINSLIASNRQQSQQLDRKYTQLKKQLTNLPFAKDALNCILRIVNNCLSTQQLSFEDLSSEFESPACKPIQKNFQNRQKIQDNSFSRISCHSIISQLNSNSNNPNYQQSDEDDTQKLLCEDCKRVFDQKSFISHMEECSRTKLQKNRQKIEKDLLNLESEHRKSTSQLKKKNTIQYQPVLKQLSPIQNKMQKKTKATEGYQSANQFSRLVNQYRSNKYY